MTVLNSRVYRFLCSLLLLLALPMLHAAPQGITTIVFFAEKPLPDPQWSNLFLAIQNEFRTRATEWKAASSSDDADSQFLLLRGDRVQPGIVVDQSISVYLHGDCSTIPAFRSLHLATSLHPGSLGWVEFSHGQISPFIHIDCALLTQVLALPSHFTGRSHDDLLALAIARIFLHEWLHISTQNPHHAHTGIAKSEFTAEDLIGQPGIVNPRAPSYAQPIFHGTAHGK